MSDDWTQGNPTRFRCLKCGESIGTFPETTRGLPPTCAMCAAQPPTIHEHWFRRADGRAGRRAEG
jgi:NAD-dependent SIR2 family protein deacetylase